MPNRMIRDGLLESPRYWAVTIDERQLFWHLMLLADDFGLVSLAPVFLRRRAFCDAPPQTRIDKQLVGLEAVDLIRTYEVGGVRYAFLPRFRQTLRIENPKHPMPPRHLFEDDKHATDKFNKNKEKFEKLHSKRAADAPHPHSTRVPEVKRSEGKGIEEKRSEGAASGNGSETASHLPAEPPVDKDRKVNGKTVHERAEVLGIQQYPGEALSVFTLRVASAESKARAST